MTELDSTHDPATQSWVESANAADTDFPIQNLPFGLFRTQGSDAPQVGVAIGDQILPLAAAGDAESSLDAVMARPVTAQRELRQRLHALLRADAPASRRAAARDALVPMSSAEMLVPMAAGDYTDFFASIQHATNALSMIRPGAPLFPNYRHIPLAYHGRSSSIVISGTPIVRPRGAQRRREHGPVYEPTRRLDYECELGWVVGTGSRFGAPVPIASAWDHLFGVCLMNDWSARDVQAFEAEPLGPFLAKSFATTVSPWVVTREALAPFHVAPPARQHDDPPLLDYLSAQADREAGAVSIVIDVFLETAQMRQVGTPAVRLTRASAAGQYWTPAQLVAHQTANGCNLRPGDLLGSGTVSGTGRDSWGCLLELTRGGREPMPLPDGETRGFLEDGDEVIIRGRCVAPGARSIGFGECRGRIEVSPIVAVDPR